MIQYRVRRDINVLSKNLAKIATQKDSKIQDLVRACDKVYADSISDIISLSESNNQINIFADLKEVIEDIGNNPPDPTRFPFGPFEAINNLYGSLHRPGNITIIGARTSVGKTAYSMFYNIWMAEKYNWPILWQDFGEMTKLELQLRAAACLTAGEVSLSSIEDGSWRRDAAATKKIREQWPRVEKLKLCYEDVSKFDPKQILTSVRKFYYNTAGRNNKFIWCLDYLKPFDTDDFNTPEWKQMGHFIQDVKSFITGEIETNLFTSIQLNKFGITNNKSSANVDDSENSVSMSDRITQQSSHTFILRRKTND
jgi:replicative DNA helicase